MLLILMIFSNKILCTKDETKKRTTMKLKWNTKVLLVVFGLSQTWQKRDYAAARILQHCTVLCNPSNDDATKYAWEQRHAMWKMFIANTCDGAIEQANMEVKDNVPHSHIANSTLCSGTGSSTSYPWSILGFHCCRI